MSDMKKYKCPIHNSWTTKQSDSDKRYCALCKKLVQPRKTY